MNLLLLEPAEVADGLLRDRRARHAREVLRVTPGMRLRAGVVHGPIGDAVVIEVRDDAVQVRFTATGDPPPPLPVDLVLAVPRPKVLARVLQAVASIGVRRVDLVNAWRVDKSYLGSSRLAAGAIAADLRLGAEQGATTHLPEVVVHPLLMPFLDGAHPPGATSGIKLLAHARGGVDIEAGFAPGAAGPIVLAIGPEGGWIDREVATFAARGFVPVLLGAPILRVEAAVVAALAQLALLRRLPARP